ncbi:MAG TPA: DUF2336 domain-containing protein [Xanthobacteraceae bacterium]|nr:DUF2336 domain-containing protein [Xanthobacteraceae bacterium]
MHTQQSLILQLEEAIASGSSEKRVETLRRVTQLFLGEADRLNEAQVGVFDDVLCHLIKRIETKALVELSGHLAPVDNAPIAVVQRLARNDEIAVAGPVLTQSARLTTDDLVEIAGTKSQQHLLAISGRNEIEEAVTDVLIDRGDREVVHRLARNAGARFSETGFTRLVRNAETDESLAEKLGLRLDIPLRLLRDLLLKATDAVRARLLALAPAETREEVQRVLSKISNEVAREAAAGRDFSQAQQAILQMKKEGRLNEDALMEFAARRLYEQMVAALSMLSGAQIDLIATLMQSARSSGLLVPCKAAGLKWPTVRTILANRFAHHTMSEADLAFAKEEFLKLSPASSQRILRFWQVRTSAGKVASTAI